MISRRLWNILEILASKLARACSDIAYRIAVLTELSRYRQPFSAGELLAMLIIFLNYLLDFILRYNEYKQAFSKDNELWFRCLSVNYIANNES